MVGGSMLRVRGKGGTKRGHGQQNLGLGTTASVTICQVRNKYFGLNGLRTSLTDKKDPEVKSTSGAPGRSHLRAQTFCFWIIQMKRGSRILKPLLRCRCCYSSKFMPDPSSSWMP